MPSPPTYLVGGHLSGFPETGYSPNLSARERHEHSSKDIHFVTVRPVFDFNIIYLFNAKCHAGVPTGCDLRPLRGAGIAAPRCRAAAVCCSGERTALAMCTLTCGSCTQAGLPRFRLMLHRFTSAKLTPLQGKRCVGSTGPRPQLRAPLHWRPSPVPPLQPWGIACLFSEARTRLAESAQTMWASWTQARPYQGGPDATKASTTSFP